MATKTLASWPLGFIALGGVATLWLLVSTMGELDPLNGEWRIDRALEAGRPVPGADGWRIFLSIEGDHASIASHWTCGVRQDTLAEGVMVRSGDRVDLYRRVRMTPELETHSDGYFEVLPNHEIGYEMEGPTGGSMLMVFRRESNTPTLLDVFGWR